MGISRRSSARPLRHAAPAVVLSCLLVACGGGESGVSEDADPVAAPATVPPTAQCGASGGIEGGGRSKLAGVVTSVASDGQVTVSSIRFVTADASIFRDGVASTIAAIEPGQIVSVIGDIDITKQTGCAQSVTADAAVIGAIEFLDVDDRSLRMLGQQIVVRADASFDDGLSFAALKVGDRVRVSGSAGLGSLVASRVDVATLPEGYFIAGPIIGLDAVRSRFLVNGIIVDYRDANLIGPLAALRDGNTVRVSGTELIDDPSLPGSRIALPGRIELIESGLSIEPSPAYVTAAETIQFKAWGLMDSIDWRVLRGDGMTCQADECGRIESDGRYSAPNVMPAAPLIITASSRSDPAISASTTVQVLQQAPVVRGTRTLRGQLSGVSGPITDGLIYMWVQDKPSGRGYSYWYANDRVYTDDAGRFTAGGLPDWLVAVVAYEPGYVQPCAVTVQMAGDTTVEVPLVAATMGGLSVPPRPNPAPAPSVTGQIYEMSPSGRQPIADASIWLEDPMGITYGYTYSDREGNYFVCNVGNLPTPGWVTAAKDGFQYRSVGPVDPHQSSQLDIELLRINP